MAQADSNFILKWKVAGSVFHRGLEVDAALIHRLIGSSILEYLRFLTEVFDYKKKKKKKHPAVAAFARTIVCKQRYTEGKLQESK